MDGGQPPSGLRQPVGVGVGGDVIFTRLCIFHLQFSIQNKQGTCVKMTSLAAARWEGCRKYSFGVMLIDGEPTAVDREVTFLQAALFSLGTYAIYIYI